MTAYSYYNMGCGRAGNCSGVARALATLEAQGVKRSDYFLSSMTPPCRVPAPLTAEKCYNYP